MAVSNRIQLIIFVSLILLVSFISVSVINFNTAKKAIRDEIVHSALPLLRENIYSEIKKDVVPAVNIASMMSNDSFLKNWAMRGEKNPADVLQYLQEIRKEYGFFSTFFVSHQTKKYYHYSGIHKIIRPQDEHDVWYYNFVASGKEYVLDVDTDEVKDKVTIFINFRLEDFSGDLLGVTGVGIEMERFSQFLRQKQQEYNRRIYFVNEEGIIQAHSDTGLIGKLSIKESAGIRKEADVILHQHREPINVSYTVDGENVLVTSRYVPEMDWFLIVEQNETEALRSARRNLWRTIFIGVVTSLLIITISTITINHFQKRLEVLAVTDDLTGTVNRRELEKQFERAKSRFSRHGIPITFVLLDIDKFKAINDTKGHTKGDEVLKQLSMLIQENIRPDDVFSRLGGDEFVLMVEQRKEEARQLVERIRNMIVKQEVSFTISAGVAEFVQEDTFVSILQKADKAMYTSKRRGGDAVSLYKE